MPNLEGKMMPALKGLASLGNPGRQRSRMPMARALGEEGQNPGDLPECMGRKAVRTL